MRQRSHGASFGTRLGGLLFIVAFSGCAPTLGEDISDEVVTVQSAVTCSPQMSVFPVIGAHNIGYDKASCGTGTCATSCPDAHANSDWGGAHHGIDVFAHHRASLVAVAAGTIVKVGVNSSTSGLRVRLRDRCGWEYYYGHLDEAVVRENDSVVPGQLLGYMGHSGTSSTHLHFNVSPDGDYNHDINPLNLLVSTSSTACSPPPPPPPPPPGDCGLLAPGQVLNQGQWINSCDGRFTLAMQADGNLVLYTADSVPLWHTYTNGLDGRMLAMQTDGNLVLYAGDGTPLWHTHTDGQRGAWLAIQDDGNLVVYLGSTAIWNSGTCCH